MLGSGLKKLAAQHNMQLAQGVAYGTMRGYTATLSEGAGWKRLDIATHFPDAAKRDQLRGSLTDAALQKEYRVQALTFLEWGIRVVFLDNPGTMKKLEAFLDYFFPLLDESGATGANICPACGGQLNPGSWKLINGAAYCVHESCAQKLTRQVEAEAEDRKRSGSWLTGLIGALLGALVGAILWGIIMNFGYIASIVAFAMGWLAEKGYNLLRGRQSKIKVVILVIATLFGVLLGIYLGQVIELGVAIHSGELPITYGDIPAMLHLILVEDADYLRYILGQTAIGLLFGALGVFGILRRAGKEVSGLKIIDLKPADKND